MNSENDFAKLEKQVKYGKNYSQKDWEKDVEEFSKLSVTLSDEHSKDLAMFMVLMINSPSPEWKKQKMFKVKYKVLTQLTLNELGENGYIDFVKQKMERFKVKK